MAVHRVPLPLILLSFASYSQDLSSQAAKVIESRCLLCHSSASAMSGLDLSSRDSALKGGTRGAAIVPGDAGASLVIQAVERKGKLAMPPAAVLDASEIEILRRWVEVGARWPSTKSAASAEWWSFRKPVRPETKSASPIDDFVAAGLKEKGLRPAPRADAAELIRRLYFDLTGLPPTADQVKAFVADHSPGAYQKLVEELLASPRYGEKWGRHWLDLVRYSDTAGFELDTYIADAWRYRDWVIDSFNEDKPYDRFLREQIAGDEFYPEDPVAQTGTGYFCVGPNRDGFPDQADINRVETLTDFVDTTASVFLGLTAGCARCHDHKYDPIPQRDYYRLQAFFAPFVKTRVALSRLDSLAWDRKENVNEIKLREIGERIRAIESRCKGDAGPRPKAEELRACLNASEKEQLQAIERQLVSMFAGYRPKPFACGLTDLGDHAPKTYVPDKGGGKGEEVRPGFPAALGGGDVREMSFERPTTGPIPLFPTTGRRKALADWIASPENPLTARVMVNRIWQYHFGRGIVATASNFGARGSRPTHPELLDWLATEFVKQKWSVKAMHRIILHSEAYRRRSRASEDLVSKDPENLWLARFNRRRLDAEELRDAVLFTTGSLNLKMGGRPVVPPLTQEELYNLIGRPDEQWIVTSDESEHRRRSVYLFQKRTFRMPMMEVFDAPESMLTCSMRDSTTTAPQSLTLLNGTLVMQQARALAASVAGSGRTLAAELWRRLLGREASPKELRDAESFLALQEKQTGGRDAAASELIRALINTNEFQYLD